jgi:hypothetical protein
MTKKQLLLATSNTRLKRICKSRHSGYEVRTPAIRWRFSTIFVSLISWKLCPSYGNVILHTAYITNLCFSTTLRISSDYLPIGLYNVACGCLEVGNWLNILHMKFVLQNYTTRPWSPSWSRETYGGRSKWDKVFSDYFGLTQSVSLTNNP